MVKISSADLKHAHETSVIPCWRKHVDLEGHVESFCEGPAMDEHLMVSLPLVLYLAVNRDEKGLARPPEASGWNFPLAMHPFASTGAKKHHPLDCRSVTYTLVGRLLANTQKAHFAARLAGMTPGDKVYHYDDIAGQGLAKEVSAEGRSQKSLLAGRDSDIALPSGFETYYAVYCLEGGYQVQQQIVQYQSAMLLEKYGLELSSTTFVDPSSDIEPVSISMVHPQQLRTLSNDERYWLAPPTGNEHRSASQTEREAYNRSILLDYELLQLENNLKTAAPDTPMSRSLAINSNPGKSKRSRLDSGNIGTSNKRSKNATMTRKTKQKPETEQPRQPQVNIRATTQTTLGSYQTYFGYWTSLQIRVCESIIP